MQCNVYVHVFVCVGGVHIGECECVCMYVRRCVNGKVCSLCVCVCVRSCVCARVCVYACICVLTWVEVGGGVA